VSPAFAGCQVPVDPGHRMGESSARRRTALLKKEPAIGDGSQSREKRQSTSIRGRAMCRNSHTKRETLSRERKGRPGSDARRP
jgi:hypothetical protein